MCQGGDGEVFSYWPRENLRSQIEGEVKGGEAFRNVLGCVLGSGGGEGGDRLRDSGRGWVGVRGGADDSEGGQAPFVSAIGDNGGEACFPEQDGGGGREEVVRRPSLDSVPESVHASEPSVVRGKEVGSVSMYREEEAIGDTVGEEGSDAGSWGGEALDEEEDSLG